MFSRMDEFPFARIYSAGSTSRQQEFPPSYPPISLFHTYSQLSTTILREPSCHFFAPRLFSRQIEPESLKNFAAQLKGAQGPQGSCALNFLTSQVSTPHR